MLDVAIIIPTLGRPDRIRETLTNVGETAPTARCHFVIEQDDGASFAAIKKSGLTKWDRSFTMGDFGTYGRAINGGYADCPEPIVMTADDDCLYHPGWLESALEKFAEGFMVVGTNDLHNPYVLEGKHSTHSLLDRRYIDEIGCVVDQGPGSFMYDYDHNYTDAELIETAKARGVFSPCLEAVVEHIHPEFGGRPPDDTWRKTRRAVQQDHDTFSQRQHLWAEESRLTYRDDWAKVE